MIARQPLACCVALILLCAAAWSGHRILRVAPQVARGNEIHYTHDGGRGRVEQASKLAERAPMIHTAVLLELQEELRQAQLNAQKDATTIAGLRAKLDAPKEKEEPTAAASNAQNDEADRTEQELGSVTPTQQLTRDLLLVYASVLYGAFKTDPDRVIKCPGTDLRLTISTNMSRAPEAHGLIYYGPDIAREPPFYSRETRFGSFRKPGEMVPVKLLDTARLTQLTQVNIYYTEEPPFSSGYAVNQKTLGEMNKTAMQSFQVFAGANPMQMEGRVGQVCYVGWGMRAFNSPAMFGERGRYWGANVKPFAERRTDFDSCWVQSNCNDGFANDLTGQSRRTELVKILMKNNRVASLGSCLHNADFSEAVLDNRAMGGKQDAWLQNFKFMLTFENNRAYWCMYAGGATNHTLRLTCTHVPVYVRRQSAVFICRKRSGKPMP